MPRSSSALLMSLVAVVAAAVLSPDEKGLISQLQRQVMSRFRMENTPDMGMVHTMEDDKQHMLRRYHRRVQEKKNKRLTFYPSGFRRGYYLIFDFGTSDLNSFEGAQLRFPNSSTVDVSTAVRNWRENPSGFLRIDCKEHRCGTARLKVTFRGSRKKKPVCSGDCCRKSLRISFKELGWSNFLHPEEFEAYYCAGRCRNVTSNLATNHAIMQSVMKTKGRSDKLHLCCAPQKLRSLDVRVLNSNGSESVLSLPNAIVKTCSCS